MNKLLDLGQKKDALVKASEAIHADMVSRNATLTAEERTALNKQLSANLDELKAINDSLSLEQQLAAASNVPGDRGRSGGSIEIRDFSLEKPFGPEARSNETVKQRKDRMYVGFGEQLQAVRNAALNPHAIDPRLLELNRRAAQGASEAVPADGGFLVFPDFADEILMIQHDTGLVYTRGQQIPLSENTNAIKIPAVDEQSRADGSRWGGVRAYWMNEADALTGSKPKFRLLELVTKKLGALFYSTDELLADARALGYVVTKAFGEELGFKMDDAAVNGDGAGKPLGIMNANALITVAKETGQAASTIVTQNVVKMFYRLHARSRKNAVWFVNQDTEQQLLTLTLPVGTGGSSVVEGMGPAGMRLYRQPGIDGNDSEYAMLYGRPVIPIEQAATLGTSGDIILADMNAWVWCDKGAPQQAVSMHVRFLTDEQTFRIIYRVDGQPWWHTALTPFKGSNTQSPYVALAAR